MPRVRVARFWMDNASGTLTEFTNDVNSAELSRAVEILEDSGLNDNDASVVSGRRSYSVPLNGFYNQTTLTSSITRILDQAQGTSVSKTWQLKVGTSYYSGECFPEGLSIPTTGKDLIAWSCTLRGDGAVTHSSVALP